MFYKNEFLRGAGEKVPMTQDDLNEYIKCKQDIFYFTKYFTIIGRKGEETIKLRPYQEKVLKTFIAKIPRKKQ